MFPHKISTFLALSALLVPTLALAWSQDAQFSARVHRHEFSRVIISTEGCTLKARLFFDAPEAAFKDELAFKNHYRFHARIRLDNTHDLVTRVFHNDEAGAREYDFAQDTSNEGCWAKAEAHVRSVDVEGCRGRGCRPDPFK